ncbi:hypothetical protein XH88_04925 [Bradyrhizobium sp. CCBAU 51627]|nr:hypothetical protein [Bradyrhizobium sp. CCBAU 51627]
MQSRFATCSGTLIVIEGALYFLTAGHVLKSLKELRDSRDITIEGASLADVFGHQRISDTPIPFDFKNAQLCFVDDDELGLDFGIVPIGAHHARLLAKNGVVALSEENWASSTASSSTVTRCSDFRPNGFRSESQKNPRYESKLPLFPFKHLNSQ